ncbi:MAG TPA: sulfite exporter TauE/SafE family protein [Bacteroidales bacterium]|nr:sulfite exporter TauE/SafE family protein [Bacteroidales bacterium]
MIFHSAFDNSYLWLPLIGFLVGMIGTLIGGGGGFFFIPVLTLLFNVPAQIALTTSLAATLPICIIGSIVHYRNGNIDIRVGSVFAIAGIFGALAGATLTSLISPGHLKISWGIYAILMAANMIISNWIKKRNKANGIEKPGISKFEKIAKSSFFGFLAGVITATFGTSGATPVQAGLFTMRMPVKVVIGTTLLVVMVNTASALGAHFLVGDMDLTLVYFITAGTIVGALLGPKLLDRVKLDRVEGPIRQWYALGMIAFGILMIIS